MPPLRCKGLIPVLAVFTVIFCLWCVERFHHTPSEPWHHPLEKAVITSLLPSAKRPIPAPVLVPGPVQSEVPEKLCDLDVAIPIPFSFPEWLGHKNYTRVYFQPRHVDPETKFSSMEVIDKPVLQPFRPLHRGMRAPQRPMGHQHSCPSVVDVNVGTDVDVKDTEMMLFGLATTIERLNRMLPSLMYSYGHTKASLLVLVPKDTKDIASHETYFRSRGLDVTLKASPLKFTARYFGLVEAFTEHIKKNRPNTTWVGWVDDDTFFPSLGRIAKRLADLDSGKKHYIGALSEASGQVDIFGHIAFGGAGVFVSKTLLEKLVEVYDKCQDFSEQPGDQKLAQCIDKQCGTRLTIWDSLYQMDMRGEPDGVFESGRIIDSLHHWNSWYNKDVVKMSSVAAAAGRDSVLRRWRFDEKEIIDPETGTKKHSFWVLTNGYSIIRYMAGGKLGASTVNFDKVEKTWADNQDPYEKRLGPMRPKNQDGVEKQRWMLRESIVIGENVHQLYMREEVETHSIIEVVWLGPWSHKRGHGEHG
ncbi:hypothetical protein AJ80_01891 [Polytolypa hystricis UAMH7299]|uniref:Glycosyltransferase family 31 protein n=1 Tax=Polytolypa hystricis (strain UAMH7299) TaxID=1447883 RepID=A0A2B7YZK2_POLH7|nr:hypothetical protein AJ80_01891 [Polytolypa hystricis UAMH7299]